MRHGIGTVLGGWLVEDFWLAAWFGGFLGEPVVHSTEWTTGAALFLVFGLVWAISWELVVHSMEWTTGSRLSLAFDLISALYPEELTDFLGF